MKPDKNARIPINALRQVWLIIFVTSALTLAIFGGIVIVNFWPHTIDVPASDITEWRAQVETIHDKVSLFDPAATLARIFINPLDEGLRVRMLFVDSQNRYIDVMYQYDRLEETLNINPNYGDVSIPDDVMSAQERQARMVALSSTTVTPKQILAITQINVKGDTQTSKSPPLIEAVLELDSEKNKEFTTPSTWVISYYGDVEKLRLWVSGNSGEILKTGSPYE